MSDNLNSGGYDDPQEPNLKAPNDLDKDSIPFIFDASSKGLEIIVAPTDDPTRALHQLRQLFTDIQLEISFREEVLRNACTDCRRLYSPGTQAYGNCITDHCL